VGPRGVGKTTLAHDLAAGLLCLDEDAVARPCRACPACRRVDADHHPDVHVIVPEGAGEQIRLTVILQLASELALTAVEGRFRVVIIESAQRMNPDAQNALLKTLEEPGRATCLILCADDAAPLLPTVLSRSTRLRLAPLPDDMLADLLVADGHAERAQARTLAIASGGRPGLAIRLTARPEAVLARAGIARLLLDLVDADRRRRLAAAADLISDGATVDAALRGEVAPSSSRLQPLERRRAVVAALDTWRDLGRDLAMAAHGCGSAVRDRDLLEELMAAGDRVDAAALARFLDHLDRLSQAIEAYASPDLTLDVLLLTWPRPTPARSRHTASVA
jgi:DNA polymerase-3 subunit delta'